MVKIRKHSAYGDHGVMITLESRDGDHRPKNFVSYGEAVKLRAKLDKAIAAVDRAYSKQGQRAR